MQERRESKSEYLLLERGNTAKSRPISVRPISLDVTVHVRRSRRMKTFFGGGEGVENVSPDV
jgi:hypothetical protein